MDWILILIQKGISNELMINHLFTNFLGDRAGFPLQSLLIGVLIILEMHPISKGFPLQSLSLFYRIIMFFCVRGWSDILFFHQFKDLFFFWTWWKKRYSVKPDRRERPSFKKKKEIIYLFFLALGQTWSYQIRSVHNYPQIIL